MKRSRTQQSYEDTPYLSVAYPESSIEHLRNCLLLRGYDAPSCESTSVLEIGCASGGNLLPMAYRHPNGKFVGIDFSKEQILEAKEMRQQLGLKNLFLVEESFVGYCPPEGQKFDYIIAHGILSWVSEKDREELMKTIFRSAHSGSVIYMSYNTYPGWHFKSWIRDSLKLGRDLLQDSSDEAGELSSFVNLVNTHSKLGVHQELVRELSTKAWPLLLHDELEVFNQAFHFKDFIEMIESAGFSYACDALSNSQHALKKLELPASMKSFKDLSLVEQESLNDLLVGRSHRNSLLVYDAKKNKEFSLNSFFIRSPLRLSEESTFVAEGVAVVRAQSKNFSLALGILEHEYPSFISWEKFMDILKQKVGEWSADIESEINKRFFELIYGGILQISEKEVLFLDSLNEKPTKHPLAVFNFRNARGIVNALHQQVSLTEDLTRLIQLCDGSRKLDEIQQEFSSGTNISNEDCLKMLNDLRRQFLIL